MKNIVYMTLGLMLLATAWYLLSGQTQEQVNNTDPVDENTNELATSTQTAFTQDPSWAPCDGLFPYTGNQGNSTFIDTTAGANLYLTGVEDVISDGYEVRGCVRQIASTYDNWAPFEANIGSYRVKDSNGSVITSGPLSAMVITNQPDTMSAAMAGDNLGFIETINYDFAPYAGQSGTLEITNGNPSGEPQNDRTVQYSIVF